ncbi:hypothetical protein ACWD2L_05930 [Streptomyces sp. NPDC002754]
MIETQNFAEGREILDSGVADGNSNYVHTPPPYPIPEMSVYVEITFMVADSMARYAE